jgi:hypothetical protein
MSTTKRPFFRYSIVQLETIVEKRQAHEDMSDIFYELSFRRTSRAKTLQKKLSSGDYKSDVKKPAPSIISNQSKQKSLNANMPKSVNRSLSEYIPLIIIIFIVGYLII